MASACALQLTSQSIERPGQGTQPAVSRLPNDLFEGRHIYVDSVPLAFASIAASYQRLIRKGKLTEASAVVRLVKLIMESVGHYGRDPANPAAGTATENLATVTTVEEIRSFIDSSAGVKGVTLLAKALAHARNGSRSPMETALFMLLTMPREYGLFGLSGAKLNTAIVPTSSQRTLMRHKTLTPDILWENGSTAVEYQGSDEHASRSARAEDSRRLNDYLTCGIHAHFVSFDDIRTPNGLDKLALEVARSMEANGRTGELGRLREFLEDETAATLRARHLAHLLPPVR